MDLVNKKLTKKLHYSVGRKELVSFLDSFLKTSHIKDTHVMAFRYKVQMRSIKSLFWLMHPLKVTVRL